eukprot:3326064-Amphidinium_carterae.1
MQPVRNRHEGERSTAVNTVPSIMPRLSPGTLVPLVLTHTHTMSHTHTRTLGAHFAPEAVCPLSCIEGQSACTSKRLPWCSADFG